MRSVSILIFSLFILVSCKQKKKPPVTSDIYYTCSMHPQVVQNKPGNCPICGMQLIQANRSTSEKPDEIKLSKEQIELGNIHTDTIKSGAIGDQLVLTATFILPR